MHRCHVLSASVSDTFALGHRLARAIHPTDVLALSGDLGSGKTHLCKGIAEGLGADPDLVNSPTFVLMQQYAAQIVISHFDTYRLSDVTEFEDIGGVDVLEEPGVCLIEWPERIEELLPERTVWIAITATGVESREITISGGSDRAFALIEAVDHS